MGFELLDALTYCKAKMLQQKLAYFSLRIFGNSLGLRVNLPYWIHHRISQIKSDISHARFSPVAYDKAKELRQVGFVKLGKLEVSELATDVDEFFAKNPCSDGVGFVDRGYSKKYAPKLYQLLKDPIFDALYAYYGSCFQNYWITVMRYEPTSSKKEATSFDFHLDDNPRELLKVFIYLNDTKKENGAFRTFNYSATLALIQKGFISCTSDLRTKSQSLINPEFVAENLNVLEGEAGTVLIFDNNLIHKGTVPEVGHRNIICIEIYPSNNPVTIDTLEKGLTRKFEVDYPANPFINDILI